MGSEAVVWTSADIPYLGLADWQERVVVSCPTRGAVARNIESRLFACCLIICKYCFSILPFLSCHIITQYHNTSNTMTPSPLSVATSALSRLVKEESSYHKELEQQQASVTKLEQSSGDENKEYMIRQEVGCYQENFIRSFLAEHSQRKGIEETKKLFPELKSKIKAAMDNLEDQLVNT